MSQNKEQEEEYWENTSRVANEITKKINTAQHDHAKVVVGGVMQLMNRIVSSGSSLWILYKNAPHNFDFDGAAILRALYEAHLYALYILNDPKKMQYRAELYRDYYWVEKHQLIRLIDKNQTETARQLAQSPQRGVEEPKIDSEFKRVEHKYPGKNWYPGTLRDVAKDVGYEPEYELLQKHLSGAVHSSPLRMIHDPVFKGFNLVFCAIEFSFRVMGRIAKLLNVTLSTEQAFRIESSCPNIFDRLPKQEKPAP
jgi:hypothetical protein